MSSLTPSQRRHLRGIITQAIYRKNAAEGERLFAIHASRSEVVRAVMADLEAAGWDLVPPTSNARRIHPNGRDGF